MTLGARRVRCSRDKPMAVDFRFDPAFIEETVFLALRQAEAAGDRRTAAAFQRERSAVYACEETAARDTRFQQLAARYFKLLGLAALFTGRLEDLPTLPGRVEAIVVRRVWSRKEERVELYTSTATTLLIELQASRCLDRERLIAFLRHELMHVADMLDPAFAYDPHAALGGACEVEDDLIRERFRVLWDLWTHGRMRRRGWPTLRDDTARRQEAGRAFASLDPARRTALVERVITRGQWTQRELLALAADERLTKTLGQGGVRCPLCHFPTQDGVRDWSGARAGIADAIRADYPSWKASDGACGQCVELYRARTAAVNGQMDRRAFFALAPRYLRSLATVSEPVVAGPGTVARIDADRCLAWSDADCQMCYLQCPRRDQAIVLEAGRPVIHSAACDGCGICVDACRSVNDPGAIQMVCI